MKRQRTWKNFRKLPLCVVSVVPCPSTLTSDDEVVDVTFPTLELLVPDNTSNDGNDDSAFLFDILLLKNHFQVII